jgi:hypothetical protein
LEFGVRVPSGVEFALTVSFGGVVGCFLLRNAKEISVEDEA